VDPLHVPPPASRVSELLAARPDLAAIRLRTPLQTAAWLAQLDPG